MDADKDESLYSLPLDEELHFFTTFQFTFNDILSWKSFVAFMYRPMNSNSLGVIRAMFGFMMVLDIPQERGLGSADIKWGNIDECRFPLFDFLKPLPLDWMCIVYLFMWIGAVGIMLGIFYKITCFIFTISYWYLLLLDKSTWNNHSYLYGLLSVLLLMSSANNSWSIDIYFKRVKDHEPVPLWNYAILRFQIFLLYFYAGIKKLDTDWLSGYSMTNLSKHWVFEPLRMIFSDADIDYYVVHLCGIFLDIFIGYFLIIKRTRLYAMLCCLMFHVINSRIFRIGMFPYVCIITLPIFCDTNWPSNFHAVVLRKKQKDSSCNNYLIQKKIQDQLASKSVTKKFSEYSKVKQQLVVVLLIVYVLIQILLPFSHFITKGYNNWTNGLYGYSWDMMVYNWNTGNVMTKVADHKTGREYFLHPKAFVQSTRWSKHGDMLIQYAKCLKYKFQNREHAKGRSYKNHVYDNVISDNISIYFDIWCSLNKRFQQRMFDPNVDFTQVDWTPFTEISWLMPILIELSTWRKRLIEIEQEVLMWSNSTDLLFIADFSGMTFESYIPLDISNITLQVLQGEVIVEQLKKNELGKNNSKNITLSNGMSISLNSGQFHKIHTTSKTPSCYMYTFTNETLKKAYNNASNYSNKYHNNLSFNDIQIFMKNLLRAFILIKASILNIISF